MHPVAAHPFTGGFQQNYCPPGSTPGMAEKNLSPETIRRLIVVVTAELIIESALIVLLLVVLRRELDLVTLAVIIVPAILFGAYIRNLITNDRNKPE